MKYVRRLNTAVLIIIYLSGCSAQSINPYKNPSGYLRSVQDKINPSGLLVVSVLNPNDCLNCYPLIRSNMEYVLNNLDCPRNNLIYILPQMREVEKQQFLKVTLQNSLEGFTVIENDTLYHAFYKNSKLSSPFLISIYNSNDVLIFTKNYKYLNTTNDLKLFIKKNPIPKPYRINE